MKDINNVHLVHLFLNQRRRCHYSSLIRISHRIFFALKFEIFCSRKWKTLFFVNCCKTFSTKQRRNFHKSSQIREFNWFKRWPSTEKKVQKMPRKGKKISTLKDIILRYWFNYLNVCYVSTYLVLRSKT